MTPFSILHISDLHRSPSDQISNDELISALVSDRNRYIHEDPPIQIPEAIIVSGDIIQGVPLETDDFVAKLDEQYAVAEEFFNELVHRFLEGDKSRLIMVPGNHDVDWNTAFSSFERVDEKDIPQNLYARLSSNDSDLRWDWKTRTVYRIADPDQYEKRQVPFRRFYDRFYQGVSGLLNVQGGNDANFFSLCGDRIGVAAYNSCHGNDCFASHGMIRKDVIARSHLDLDDSGKVFDLRIAVWHHNIEGGPYHTDYMDADIVRGMIGRGFRLGLHGHQHKTQIAPRQVWLPDQERMAVVSAGSLCAGTKELPTGVHRQYNILEIANDFKSVRVHVRSMAVANLFSQGRLVDFGGTSFAELDWELPRNASGSIIDTRLLRKRAIINKAEMEVKTGDSMLAIKLLEGLDLPPGSYERQLSIIAAADANDWSVIIKVTDPPSTIEELVQRFEAFLYLSDPVSAKNALDNFSQQLELPQPIEIELRGRANAQEAMRQ
jgi:hypothetical protein